MVKQYAVNCVSRKRYKVNTRIVFNSVSHKKTISVTEVKCPAIRCAQVIRPHRSTTYVDTRCGP